VGFLQLKFLGDWAVGKVVGSGRPWQRASSKLKIQSSKERSLVLPHRPLTSFADRPLR